MTANAQVVEHLGQQNCHVISRPKRISADVRSDSCESKREGGKEGGGAVIPSVDEEQGVPEHLPIQLDSCTCDRNASKATEYECDRDDQRLHVLTVRRFVSAKSLHK